MAHSKKLACGRALAYHRLVGLTGIGWARVAKPSWWRAAIDVDKPHLAMTLSCLRYGPIMGPFARSIHDNVEASDVVYESHSTGTFKACASFAMVSGVPIRRPLSRSDR